MDNLQIGHVGMRSEKPSRQAAALAETTQPEFQAFAVPKRVDCGRLGRWRRRKSLTLPRVGKGRDRLHLWWARQSVQSRHQSFLTGDAF